MLVIASTITVMESLFGRRRGRVPSGNRPHLPGLFVQRSSLEPLPPEPAAKKYVENMGGATAVLQKASVDPRAAGTAGALSPTGTVRQSGTTARRRNYLTDASSKSAQKPTVIVPGRPCTRSSNRRWWTTRSAWRASGPHPAVPRQASSRGELPGQRDCHGVAGL